MNTINHITKEITKQTLSFNIYHIPTLNSDFLIRIKMKSTIQN